MDTSFTTNLYVNQEDRDAAIDAYLRREGWLDESDPAIAPDQYDDARYEMGSNAWLCLDDDEADARAKEYILDSLWAFNADFLESYVPAGIDADTIRIIQEKHEGANDPLRAMIGDRFDELVADAIQSDGRGHFLASYDDDEIEHTHAGRTWCIYRD